MEAKLISLCILILFTSCKREELDYKKIDFQTRQIIMSTRGVSYNKPTLKKTSLKKKKLFKLYERQIKEYQDRLLVNFELLDSLINNKEVWIKKIRKSQKERKIDIYGFSSPEPEYELIVEERSSNIEKYNRELDSIKKLYKKTSMKAIYYEIDYNINGYSENRKYKVTQDIRVWVNTKSKVFDYLFLNLPKKLN